jgi:hypothetical protein
MTEPDFKLFSSLRYDPLLTSLPINTEAWDGDVKSSPFYMLPYHRDRMLQAAEHFNWTAAADAIRGPDGFTQLLKKLTETIDTQSSKPLRVRVLLNKDGTIKVESNPTPESSKEALYPARIPPPKSASSQMEVSPLTGGALELGDNDAVHGDPPKANPFDVIPDTSKTAPSLYTSYKTTSRDMYNDARHRVGIEDMTARQEVLLVSDTGEIMEGSLTSPYFWREGKWMTPSVDSGGQIGTTRRWALEKG